MLRKWQFLLNVLIVTGLLIWGLSSPRIPQASESYSRPPGALLNAIGPPAFEQAIDVFVELPAQPDSKQALQKDKHGIRFNVSAFADASSKPFAQLSDWELRAWVRTLGQSPSTRPLVLKQSLLQHRPGWSAEPTERLPVAGPYVLLARLEHKASKDKSKAFQSYFWASNDHLILSNDKLRANKIGTELVKPAADLKSGKSGTLELPGKIVSNPDRTVHIAPRLSGTIVKINKHPGDRVEQDELLGVIDSPQLGDLYQAYQDVFKRAELACQWYVQEPVDSKQDQATFLMARLNELELLSSELKTAREQLELLGLPADNANPCALKPAGGPADSEQAADRARIAAMFRAKPSRPPLARPITDKSSPKPLRTSPKGAASSASQALQTSCKALQEPVLTRLSLCPQAKGLDAGKKTCLELRSPLSGQVLSQDPPVGSLLDAGTDAFVIADLCEVRAELSIPESKLALVNAAEPARVAPLDPAPARQSPLPAAQKTAQKPAQKANADRAKKERDEKKGSLKLVGSQPLLSSNAYAVLQNSLGLWQPEMLVNVSLSYRPHFAADDLLVSARAIHYLGGKPVIFVRGRGLVVQAIPVTLGSSSQDWVVVKQLPKGQSYYAGNSFLLKAELEKKAFEHGAPMQPSGG